jgi:hypothetical protein
MTPSRWVAGFLIGFLALRPVSSACPWSTPTTWELVREAELIALVRVDAFERDRKLPSCESASAAPGDSECDVAVLRILETWKGSLRSEVRVSFAGSLLADHGKVAVGDELVVFLESGETQVRRALEGPGAPLPPPIVVASADDESAEVADDEGESELSEISDVPPESSDVSVTAEDLQAAGDEERLWLESRIGRWYVSGWGSGVRAVKEEAVSSIREFLVGTIRLQDSVEPSPEAIREWLIQAASTGSTRRYAIEDLQRTLGVSADPAQGRIRKTPLSENERQTLAAGFIRDPREDESVPLLMSLLSGHEDESVDAAFAHAIAGALSASPIPSWTPDAIRFLIARRGLRDWGAEMWRQDLEAGNLRKRWPRLLKDLRLAGDVPSAGSELAGDQKSR